jgi:protein-tyrosine-phosphatase/predicted ATP-grasp superfamily ATP-dependent carboligase
MQNVLVIGDDLRSFLAIVRSLGRKGLVVHAAPFDFSTPALASRYLSGVHRLPPYALSAEKWLAALQGLIVAHAIDLIIPCDDRSLLPLHHHQHALNAAVALPNEAAMAVFFDKMKTRALAEQCGVPTAAGGAISAELAARIGLPLAVKPRASMLLVDIGNRGAVKIARNTQALSAALERALPHEDYFLEAFFQGDGVGISVLAEHGTIRQAFQHRRLQEASEAGGSSSRVSEALDPEMLAAVRALCAATDYHGVGMFEFRHDPLSGAFVLLEVNARFWGSLPLAVASGVDFPAHLHDMLRAAPLGTQQDYALGVQRHDLTGEYYRILVQSERASGMAARLGQIASELPKLFGKMWLRPQQIDCYAADDLVPWQREKKRVLKTFSQTFVSRIPVRGSALKLKSTAKMAALLKGCRESPNILILCHGNICRSPFAAQLLNAQLGGAAKIQSAGTLLKEGRHSPAEACASAQAFGADLSAHRSLYADFASLDVADVIFIFDDRNAHEIAQLGANAHKVIRMGDLIGLRAISDPYGRGKAAFDSCYAEIAAAADIISIAVKAR